MERTRREAFNEEVERYRKSLLYYAGMCDWETFKAKAGRLFDYLESIEMSEVERRFGRITRVVLILLAAVVLAIWKMPSGISAEMEGLRKLVILAALCMSSFELYFFINFKRYLAVKTCFYRKRRNDFISGIEQDFRVMVRHVS